MARKVTTFGGFKPPKKAAFKPIKPEHPKNPYQAVANRALAISALQKRLCLTFRYHGFYRVVEVHTVGTTRTDRPAMSAFQVDGQSETPPVRDWGLFCFDECFDVALSDRPSTAPHPDYKKGAKNFNRIDAEV